MATNPYVGWSVTTLLSWFLSKNNDDTDNFSNDPEELNAVPAQVGTPVPVIMGRTLLKNPLIIYYGDFSAKAYTETYAAHANFSAWSLVFVFIMNYLAAPATGHQATPATVAPGASVTTSGGSGHVTGTTTANGATVKDDLTGPLLNTLFTWLLMWLINGKNLKTTIQKGFKYRLGYQMLACMSGADIRLRGVYLKEQKVWEGNVSREEYQDKPFVIPVDDETLFGGPDEDGGFQGEIRMYLGGDNQPADLWMISQMSADSIQEELRGLTPAYRPFVSIVVPAAYIGKQASIPETWLDLQWIPNRLRLGAIGEDANPMEVIYEMHVNKEWGLSRSPDLLDTTSMIIVGQRLKQEGLGITVPITSKTEVQQVIDDICQHLDMVRYTDPKTGKLTFKLIRDDYDATNLPVFDETICSSVEYTRTVWSTTNGSICASYTDSADQYETSTITVHDPANIEINDGDANDDDVDVKYFSASGNARWAAQRELRQRGFPLAAATLVCNRKGTSVRPGDVLKLNWPSYGIKDLILRVTDVDLGDFIGGEVKITCMEDVFGMGKTKFGSSDSTDWKPPQYFPNGVQLFKYFEVPWEITQVNDSYVFAVATQPDLTTLKWIIHRYRDSTWETTNSMTKWTPTGQLVSVYPEDGEAEDTTGFEIIDVNGIGDLAARSLSGGASGFTTARNGSRLLMMDDEIMGWGNLVQMPNGHWRVQNVIRATYDTVPASHAAGISAYFLDAGYYANVTTGGAVMPAGMTTTESYNITTATADAHEEFDNTKVKSLTTRRRPELPIPPGRIRMNTHLQENARYIEKAAGNLNLQWMLRNKKQSYGCVSQDDVKDFYSGLDITPTSGLQTVLRFYVGSEKIREEVLDTSITTPNEDGTSQTTYITQFDYPWAQRCQDKLEFSIETRVEIIARLNGLESYQTQTRSFSWQPPYIVAGCESEGEALQFIQSNYQNGNIVLVFDDATKNRQISVSDMPLVVLGTFSDTQQPGAILCQNGRWMIPNGTALAITGQGTYDVLPLETGFVALSYFSPNNPGNLCAYQYNGTGFIGIAIPS